MEEQTIYEVAYESLTTIQKEEICNGCGGKGGWIKPPLKAFFETSCNHHDYGYWKGVDEVDRLICDHKLFDFMLKDCAALPWYKKPIYYPWCYLYYAAVRKRGCKFFYYGVKKRYPELTPEQILDIDNYCETDSECINRRLKEAMEAI